MSTGTNGFTVNEAACIAGVPPRQVHRIVDAGLLAGHAGTHAGTRIIADSGLLALRLAHETADLLTPEARRRMVSEALRARASRRVQERTVEVDLRPIAAAVAAGRRTLARLRALVRTDGKVMGGLPCIAGTRIPVHDVADMLANGETNETVRAAYPRLTDEQVELARAYAAIYPRRGRRRAPAWRKGVPVTTRTASVRTGA